MNARPQDLKIVDDNRLQIQWDDDQVRQYTFRELRDACPCATCREKRSNPPPASDALPILSAEEAAPLAILGMAPVGNYAYSINFSDGHDTGIYQLELLRELGAAVDV